jgi:hypothetical protein
MKFIEIKNVPPIEAVIPGPNCPNCLDVSEFFIKTRLKIMPCKHRNCDDIHHAWQCPNCNKWFDKIWEKSDCGND